MVKVYAVPGEKVLKIPQTPGQQFAPEPDNLRVDKQWLFQYFITPWKELPPKNELTANADVAERIRCPQNRHHFQVC